MLEPTREVPTKGERTIDPADVGRPWLRLECEGKVGEYIEGLWPGTNERNKQ